MNLHDPILDQPFSIDREHLNPAATQRLANHDLYFDVDANTDLVDLVWPWAGEVYAHRIQVRIVAPREEALMPIVTRFYPGHQELILGTEGVIISKRLAAPRQSDYDRSVFWLLECQAEGDRLLRLEVDIEWGEPLTQRIVDGLLVAQRNPGPARGIYAQSNAERTAVFGNPQARPDSVDIETPDRAHLVYHVLVNGTVEVPLVLAISDVGEQVAWNGFLALRDAERAYELSAKAWETLQKTGRLWTPDAAFNHAVQIGKLTAARQIQQLQTGFASSDRQVVHLPDLVACTDSFDISLSRNLLAHLRRLVEKGAGKAPATLPAHPKEPVQVDEIALLQSSGAYLSALQHHLHHHFEAELLQTHYSAVQACTEALIQQRTQLALQPQGPQLATLANALRQALDLAMQQGDDVNSVRWESEAQEAEQLAEAQGTMLFSLPLLLRNWQSLSSWETPTDRPWHFRDPWLGIALAGQAVWQGCGLQWQAGELWVQPTWPAAWPWWALLDLPMGQQKLSLLWDGTTLYATQPVRSNLPLQLARSIRALKTDELEFDLQFELKSDQDSGVRQRVLKPRFSSEW